MKLILIFQMILLALAAQYRNIPTNQPIALASANATQSKTNEAGMNNQVSMAVSLRKFWDGNKNLDVKQTPPVQFSVPLFVCFFSLVFLDDVLKQQKFGCLSKHGFFSLQPEDLSFASKQTGSRKSCFLDIIKTIKMVKLAPPTVISVLENI